MWAQISYPIYDLYMFSFLHSYLFIMYTYINMYTHVHHGRGQLVEFYSLLPQIVPGVRGLWGLCLPIFLSFVDGGEEQIGVLCSSGRRS